MSDDIIALARRHKHIASHYEGCEADHVGCLVHRLADEVERLRADFATQQGCCDGAAAQDGHIRREREEHKAEIERLRAERDALRDAAREYLTTLGGAMKAGKFQMGGTAEMAHFVRQAMQKLDSLVFDREGPRPAGLEKLHEPLKRPS